MRFRPILFTALALSFFGSDAQAELIKNHTFESGDNTYYASLDTNTGIEWLRGGVTSGLSYNEVSDRLDTDLKGWRFPTEAEFTNLLTTYYSDLNPMNGGAIHSRVMAGQQQPLMT